MLKYPFLQLMLMVSGQKLFFSRDCQFVYFLQFFSSADGQNGQIKQRLGGAEDNKIILKNIINIIIKIIIVLAGVQTSRPACAVPRWCGVAILLG